MLKDSDFPTAEEIADCLADLPHLVEPDMVPDGADEPGIDVRLQVTEGGGWSIHTGSSQYDTDHSGYWGYGVVGADDTAETILELAQDLRAEAIEDCADDGKLDLTHTYYLESGGELTLTREQVESIPQQGDVESECRALVEEVEVAEQLDRIPPEKIRADLKGYGAWTDADLQDEGMCRVRLVWVAAGHIRDTMDEGGTQ